MTLNMMHTLQNIVVIFVVQNSNTFGVISRRHPENLLHWRSASFMLTIISYGFGCRISIMALTFCTASGIQICYLVNAFIVYFMEFEFW